MDDIVNITSNNREQFTACTPGRFMPSDQLPTTQLNQTRHVESELNR